MNMLRAYLFRVICGAVISAVILSVPLQPPLKKILGFSCGCMMILLTLSPLVGMDWDTCIEQLPQVFDALPQEQVQSNEDLLRDLIAKQTAELIEQTAEEMDIRADAEVGVQYDEAVGSFVPYSAEITVYASKGSLDGLRAFLTSELAIPEERQTWKLN